MVLKMDLKSASLAHGMSFSSKLKFFLYVRSNEELVVLLAPPLIQLWCTSYKWENGNPLIVDFLLPSRFESGKAKCIFDNGIVDNGILKHPFYVPKHLCPLSPLGFHAISGGGDDDPCQDIHEGGALTDF